MKVFSAVMKILAALAAVAGVVYVVATYGDKIVAWAKGLLARFQCCTCEECTCPCEDDCDDCKCEGDCDNCCCGDEVVEEIEVVEEVVAEEAPAVEVAAEEVAAEEADFEG